LELLTSLRVLHGRVAEDGFAALIDDINRHWGGTREVELSLLEETIRGPFLGIDSRGDLLVEIDGHPVSHSASHVQLMREV
jgi:biotin-(acetyl-CoA carboxylase) ligase